MNDALKVGHYLGPSIDVGPAMMNMKILTQNGQVLHRSTYRPLTPEDVTLGRVRCLLMINNKDP